MDHWHPAHYVTICLDTIMSCIVSQLRYMHTAPLIRYDTTLSRDMHARHRYYNSQDMVLHDTRTTVIWIMTTHLCFTRTRISTAFHCIVIIITRILWFTVHDIRHRPLLLHDTSHTYFVFMSHRYIDAPLHEIPSCHRLLSSLQGFSAYHCYSCMHGFSILIIWILVSLYLLHVWLFQVIPVHITCMIVPCYYIHVIWLFLLLIWILPLLDMRAVDMRYVDSHIQWRTQDFHSVEAEMSFLK